MIRFGQRANTVIEAGEFARPQGGPAWTSRETGLPLTGNVAWRSNGGADRGELDRKRPFSLEVTPPDVPGTLARVHIVGCFAICTEGYQEPPGTLGAVIQLGDGSEPAAKLELIHGRHYSDARELRPLSRLTGDGASIETVGECLIDGAAARVDVLTIDVPADTPVGPLRFRDVGSPASFLIFDVLYEIKSVNGCPFKRRSGGVALAELASVVRVGDRVRLRRAIEQLEDALLRTEDLDEGKGQALTFIAVVTAAAIERGTREMHRIQLDASRLLDATKTQEELAAQAKSFIENTLMPLTGGAANPSGILIDKALAIVNRNFARPLTDASVADQLGLSTSHFRFLFKEVTGQPFHRYLIGLRLERAKALLMEGNMPVSEIAASVGFNGLAHFSRAFAQRFQVSPTSLRRSVAGISE